MDRVKKVALVLGSGSSRGWAHIGAIEALLEENIPIDLIVGCSVGSYVAAVYAGNGLSSLKEFVLSMDGKKIFSYFDIVVPRSGLLNGTRRLKELFSMHTEATLFSDLTIPVTMVATDLATGDKIVLKSGELMEALRATMAFPGLFAPVKVKDRWLVDGGLVDPIPVGIARATEADLVIAVDLNSGLVSRNKNHCQSQTKTDEHQSPLAEEHINEMTKKLMEFYTNAETSLKRKMSDFLGTDPTMPDIMETLANSMGIMQDRITRINLAVDPPDILVQPRLGQTKMMDFDHVAYVIEEGYIGVKERIEDIRNLL
ncbi:MAG: patatin-like phospholipase family protein [Desulfobacterium sp.]|nr:patatin-like phospholipase family protein [Desulfobacterium sp.]